MAEERGLGKGNAVVKLPSVSVVACVLGAATFTGCQNDRSIRSEPLTLAPDVWTPVKSTLMRVDGPQSEVCATVPEGYKFVDTTSSIVTDDKRNATVHARLITSTGATLDSLGVGFLIGSEKKICFEVDDRPIGERYQEIQFMATDSVRLTSVRWWSGKRRAWP